MALSDYEPERKVIDFKNEPLLSVRGLSFDDVSVLIRQHLTALQVMTESFKDRSGFGSDTFFMELITSFPDMVFDVIAIAADEPQYAAQARKLPVALQVKILTEVVHLTFEDVGGPKAFVALVSGVVQKLLPQGSKTPSTSTGGSAS